MAIASRWIHGDGFAMFERMQKADATERAQMVDMVNRCAAYAEFDRSVDEVWMETISSKPKVSTDALTVHLLHRLLMRK